MITLEQLAELERTGHYLTINPLVGRPGWFYVSLNGHGANWDFMEVPANEVQSAVNNIIGGLVTYKPNPSPVGAMPIC